MVRRIFAIGFPLLILGGCVLNTGEWHPADRVKNISESYPLPDSLRNPSPFARSQMTLGQKLFFDPRLSADGSISCASCHKPQFAFGDSVALSQGRGGYSTQRNTPPLFNLFRQKRFFRDGGVARLSEVALSSMNEVHELNLPIDTLVRRLRTIPEYVRAFEQVYNRLPDPFTVTQALMRYQLSLLSASSRYDRFRYNNDTTALNPAAIRGMQLFFSNATHCRSCHNGPDFSDGLFYRNGMPELGRPDTGRARISMDWADYARFRTPSLRNLSFTAPYMHDGRYKTILEVLKHYNRALPNHITNNLTSDLPRTERTLSSAELQDLAAFLEHLNDSIFVQTPANPNL
ncbi:MAG: cytochrome-c peroxidase [Bacteroidia bacterium]